jgi:hypothetical protein
MTDPYREWDAAYLLDALSPNDRREYEAHLAGCPECSADVALLADVPGALAALPADRALATIGAPRAEIAMPDLMPGLAAAVERDRRRGRRRFVALVAGVAAAAAAIAVAVTVPLTRDEPPVRGEVVALAQTVTSPLHADVRIVDQPWGARIETTCTYDEPPTPSDKARGYALYVTDKDGKATQIARWYAEPGSTVTPIGTTELHRDQIAVVDIRSTETGKVLLLARL